MADQSPYAAFIEDCRKERAEMQHTIETMERGQIGVGSPITLPRVNEPTRAHIAWLETVIANLDTLISAYEAEPRA